MKARDMKLPQIDQTILDSESLGALNIAIKSLDSHVRLTGVVGPWVCSETIKIMHQTISSKYVSDPTFRDCCSSLKDKCPCKVMGNLFWGSGVDLEILCSLDPRLHPDLLQGRNVLGWIIKVVHTDSQEGSAKDFSWVGRGMSSNKFTDNMKDSLRDVYLHLDITSTGRFNPAIEEQDVPRKESWEGDDDNDTLVVVEEEEEGGNADKKEEWDEEKRGRGNVREEEEEQEQEAQQGGRAASKRRKTEEVVDLTTD